MKRQTPMGRWRKSWSCRSLMALSSTKLDGGNSTEVEIRKMPFLSTVNGAEMPDHIIDTTAGR